jgi:hypothetical protein
MRYSLAAVLLPAACAAYRYANVIAQQAVGGDPTGPSWFDGLPTWHVDTSVVPASPAVPADSPARDMVFGAPLTFSVYPVDPASSFSINCTFLDDGGNRKMALFVGGVAVAPPSCCPRRSSTRRPGPLTRPP